MKKFSRANGWMELRSYASGSGAIGFSWAKSDDHLVSVDEIVTESDVSEFLRLSENEAKWAGWDIINLGTAKNPNIFLAKSVKRPFHTSRVLEMDGKRFRYCISGNTTCIVQGEGRRRHIVMGPDRSSLLFFLKNEEAFGRRDLAEA